MSVKDFQLELDACIKSIDRIDESTRSALATIQREKEQGKWLDEKEDGDEPFSLPRELALLRIDLQSRKKMFERIREGLAEEHASTNPKVECVVCAINNLGGSREIQVSVADARPLKKKEPLSDLKFSHFVLTPDAYRNTGLMVGDLVTLEMSKGKSNR